MHDLPKPAFMDDTPKVRISLLLDLIKKQTILLM